MKYLSNAFSLQMISGASTLQVTEVLPEEVAASGFVSAIGHADTAVVAESILGCPVPMNRINISLEQGDILYVAQITGGRLPEGATTLPDSFKFKWMKVEIL